jgi:hypothetical protein
MPRCPDAGFAIGHPDALLLWLEPQAQDRQFFMKKLSSIFLFLLLASLYVSAQTAQQPAQQLPPPVQVDTEKPSEKISPPKEHKITPAEAKELFRSVDDILHFASRDTLLPVKHSVKKAMVSRDQVEKYIGEKFKDDVDRIRFERSELVLKKFGLLPRDFHLHDFLIKLLGEQVAGYYDEKSKTVNLLDWVEMDTQKPVMAHELTHALQDQSFDLRKMVKKDEEIEKRGPENPNDLIAIDEQSTARTAVMEGQAMIVFVDYVLAPAGHSVQDSPKFVDFMLAQMDKEKGDSLLDSAPLLLREELMFPYGPGMKFIQQLLASGGKELAFTKVVQRMPVTSREILEPAEYLAGRRIPPLLLPDFSFLKSDYEAFDAGAIGELDVSILLKQYADNKTAERISPEWRGGSYYAAGRRGVKPADPNATGHIGLTYVSKWSNEKIAQEFTAVYAAALPKRYGNVQPAQLTKNVPGREKYMTSDGPVYIQQTGDMVIAVESFDDSIAEKLIESVLAQQTAK